MMNQEVSKQIFVKSGRSYELTYTTTDAQTVYEDLAQAMISKKINGCSYIKSIKRVPLYNGQQRIEMLYTNATKVVFTVADH